MHGIGLHNILCTPVPNPAAGDALGRSAPDGVNDLIAPAADG